MNTSERADVHGLIRQMSLPFQLGTQACPAISVTTADDRSDKAEHGVAVRVDTVGRQFPVDELRHPLVSRHELQQERQPTPR